MTGRSNLDPVYMAANKIVGWVESKFVLWAIPVVAWMHFLGTVESDVTAGELALLCVASLCVWLVTRGDI